MVLSLEGQVTAVSGGSGSFEVQRPGYTSEPALSVSTDQGTALQGLDGLASLAVGTFVDLDGEGRIIRFEEKPERPATTLIGIALYHYPKNVVPLIRQYIAEGNNPDQPGRLVQWLYPRTPVYTWTVPGIWYDIGSTETLEEANRIFARR